MKRLSALLILAFSCFCAVAQSISVVSPNGGETWDIGSSQTITWTSTGVSQVNIEVSEDNGLTWSLLGTVNATPPTYAWNVSGAGSMQALVRITDAGNNTITDVSNGTFIIGPQAAVDAGPDVVICFGTSAQLNASGVYYSSSGTPAPIYSWSPSAGLSNANIANPVASPAVTTVYTVTVEYGGTQAVDNVTVTVDHPTAGITISSPITCNGAANGQLCPNVSGGAPGYTYLWNTGSTSSCQTGLSAGVYILSVVDGVGCSASASVTLNEPPAISLSFSTTNVSCFGGTNGAVTCVVNGGTPPYSYQWSNGAIMPAVVGVFAGVYTITVTDVGGCTATATATINQPAQINISISSTDVTCHGLSNGELCSSVTGGTTPYTYQWDLMGTAQCFSNIPTGTYQLIVTDANGCTATSAGTVLEQSNLQDSIVVTGGGCSGQQGNICVYSYGGAGAVSYSWSNSQISSCATNLSAGTYFVTVTDALGCTVVDSADIASGGLVITSFTTTNVTCFGAANGSISIAVNNGSLPYQYSIDGGLTLQSSGQFNNLPVGGYSIYITDASNCLLTDTATIIQPASAVSVSAQVNGDNILPDTIILTVAGGTPPYTYSWSDGQTLQDISVTTSGIYTVTVTDANFCSVTVTNTVGCIGSCVWPGDANYDGVADNQDLLAIGIGYGTSGSVRTQQDNQWYAHISADWTDTLSTGSNYKHLDCDGNGNIDNDDTLAIVLNYGLNHPRSGTDEWRGGAPELRIVMVPDTLADGETIIAHLSLGDGIVPASNVYALSFTFNYDPLVVDSSEVSIAFDNNSWLCNSATDHLDIDKKFLSSGRIETALTRIDHTNRSGNGEIGSVSMKITTGNINGKNLAHYGMNCFISDLVVIDNQGSHLAVNAGADSAVVEYEPTGFTDLTETSALNLYPNPAKDELIVSAADLNIQQISVFDNVGQQVAVYYCSGNTAMRLDVSSLAEGLYFIKAFGKTGSARGHFIKVK